MDEFDGQVVLITGAGRGRGRALAEAFAARGAHVAANDISPVNLDELAAAVKAAGGQLRAYIEDVAKKVAVQALVKQVEDDFGRIDILINHAAVEPRAPLLDMDEWDWHRTLDVNLTGAFLMMQSVGRVMRAQGGGVIVNLIAAGKPGAQDEAAYLASVNGLAALSRAAASEMFAHNVRVHAVGTGLRAFHHADASVPNHVVEAVLFLCSEAASGLSGQIINVEET